MMTRFACPILGLALAIGAISFLLPRVSDAGEREVEAMMKVEPLLKPALAAKSLKMGSPVFIRAFKQERELELWMKPADSEKFVLFKTYPIAAASGKLGPKQAEGDRQVPEGFYFVPPSMMNPRSRFHLAFNIGYPNQFDRAHGRTGSFIMVHGSDVSIGCLAMTDQKIEEIYSLCDAAHRAGQKFFRVHIFPFRMSEEKMRQCRGHRWRPFWKNLEKGYRWFEEKRTIPNVSVQDKRYHFGNAQD